jgi:hypothetical protein
MLRNYNKTKQPVLKANASVAASDPSLFDLPPPPLETSLKGKRKAEEEYVPRFSEEEYEFDDSDLEGPPLLKRPTAVVKEKERKPKRVLIHHVNNIPYNNIERQIGVGLREFGFAVIDLNIPNLEAKFRGALASMEEFKEPATMVKNHMPFVAGAFGGLANPSSFFNTQFMAAKLKAYNLIAAELAKAFPEYTYVSQLMDRAVVRPAGTAPGAEKMHRDICPGSNVEENISFGGFLNCNDRLTQYFSCVPGSHRGFVPGRAGFCLEDAEDTNGLRLVAVPPGHIILFNQLILHEVLSKKYTETLYRLFIGWHLSMLRVPLFGSVYLAGVLDEQRVPLLPSGQKVPCYAQRTQMHPHIIARFAQHLKDEYVKQHVVKSGEHAGKVFLYPKERFTTGMAMRTKMNLTEEQRAMFVPRRFSSSSSSC